MKKSQLMLKIQNGIEVFESPIFGQIRMVMVDDEPMFCLVDVFQRDDNRRDVDGIVILLH